MSETDFASMMEGVARALWGDPNKALSKDKVELRWGDSGRRSVDVKEGTWFDHGAKEGGGVLQLIKRERGLEGQDAFQWLAEQGFPVEVRKPHEHSPKPKAEIVKTWTYTDEEGELLYEVCRKEDGSVDPVTGKKNKTFVQRHPDGAGGWVWNLKGVRRVLYRLPEIVEAVALEKLIVLVEGEKACDAAVSIGLNATTAGMGAGKWEDDYTATLTGADVLIVPDLDDEGLNHVQVVASALRGKARRVRVLMLPLENEKHDFHEWVQEHQGSIDTFEALVAARAYEWRPTPPQSRFGAVEWSRLDEPGPEFEYLVKGLLARRGLAIIGGASGAGKSFLALQLGASIATGRDFFGHRCEQGLVIYQAGEAGVGAKKRMRALRKELTFGTDVPFVLLPGDLDLHNSDDHANQFITECKAWSAYYQMPIAAIFIDTFAAATPGANENDSGDMSKVLGRCARVGNELETLVVPVHHMNADGTKLRGHTSIRANVDNVLIAQKLEIRDADDRWIRKLEVTKDKEGEDGRSIRFVLKQVKLGVDKYGDEITSCVCVPERKGSEDAAAEKVRLTDNDRLIYRALKAVLERDGFVPQIEWGLPARVRMVAKFRDFASEVRAKWTYVEDGTISAEENDKRLSEQVRKAIPRSTDRLMKLNIIDKTRVTLDGAETQIIWDLGLPRAASRPASGAAPADPDAERARAERASQGVDDDLRF